MTRIGCVLDACDFLHVSEPDQVRYHEHRRVRFIPDRRPASANPLLPNLRFATESLRPTVGIILAIAAAFVGWFYSPTAAVMIFRMMLAYDAWTSWSIRCGEGTRPIFRN